MKITPMRWADVPEGMLALCPDGVQREIGPVRPSGPSSLLVRRTLGITNPPRGTATVDLEKSAIVLVVEPDPVDESLMSAVLMFMHAGFKVEVLPS